ncbi:bifunctional protein-serine/threonine kinase/phosphatase [Psychromonas sp. 14N.309.X.WAT.B.A12]|uniref:bifunctional protein-serine/threonine kinase/phosphatase n=1 Tax=Psychromonas sp. 14N.309.X.WAT.B.A12 TaxID=2998322 RepID=UPI0025B0E447|nr:bifunctional protein-serine/threonine kinase/phosphatase [Psychromonas sp. 14N.309.X.WAT.B.A12]MDN2661898.1 bifunctional protein-serine/threonine kinase/phosphatase [Psychromonas sp. 14N.309.X.WAT.B.A12]
MSLPLSVSIGSATDKGIKSINQDYIGYRVPKEPLLSTKGIVLAMADGISSSQVSQIASETAVSNFLSDYYCTADTWSVKSAGQTVLKSINSWLHAQTLDSPNRFDKNKGYVCTFTALVLKSNTAHIFHSGDSRIYRLVGSSLEQLTEDHRLHVSDDVSYLTRALGIDKTLPIDYSSLSIEKDDLFMLATDGVFEFIDERRISTIVNNKETLEEAAEDIIVEAMAAGSDDNLSIQLVRINSTSDYQLDEVHHLTQLPMPPHLAPRMHFDGYEILRELYISSRSHVFLAKDLTSHAYVVIKIPSIDMRSDEQYLEHFMLEQWVAKRINNPHVAKAIIPNRKQNFVYLVSEYIDGISLNQWMIDNPNPSLEQVRIIIEQVVKGVQAFHRQEMIHQDLRPQNIMIDSDNTVKIIDFGSTYIAGVSYMEHEQVLRGTMRYSAPEYFLGDWGSAASDIYSIAVITYQMLSGQFPYKADIAQSRSLSAQRKLPYRSIINADSELPLWVDDTLQRALQIEPKNRYKVLSEFMYDLRHPSKQFLAKARAPLIERQPVVFWQGMSVLLLCIIVGLLLTR